MAGRSPGLCVLLCAISYALCPVWCFHCQPTNCGCTNTSRGITVDITAVDKMLASRNLTVDAPNGVQYYLQLCTPLNLPDNCTNSLVCERNTLTDTYTSFGQMGVVSYSVVHMSQYLQVVMTIGGGDAVSQKVRRSTLLSLALIPGSNNMVKLVSANTTTLEFSIVTSSGHPKLVEHDGRGNGIGHPLLVEHDGRGNGIGHPLLVEHDGRGNGIGHPLLVEHGGRGNSIGHLLLVEHGGRGNDIATPTIPPSSAAIASTWSSPVPSSSLLNSTSSSLTSSSSSTIHSSPPPPFQPLSSSFFSTYSSPSSFSLTSFSSSSFFSTSSSPSSSFSTSSSPSTFIPLTSTISSPSSSSNLSPSSSSKYFSSSPSPVTPSPKSPTLPPHCTDCSQNLALGLGIGIPATAILSSLATILLFFCCQRVVKRKRQYIRLAPTVYFDEEEHD